MRIIVGYSFLVWLSTGCSATAHSPADEPDQGLAHVAPAAAEAPPPIAEAGEPAPVEAEEPAPGAAGSVSEPANGPAANQANGPRGSDFATYAQLIYRIAACGHDGPVDARFSRKVVDRHCAKVHKRFASFDEKWGKRAGEFIAGLRPADLPDSVIYPFGGGDLVSALVVYPDAREITTISLEAAGDPRTIEAMSGKRLGEELQIIRGKYERLLRSQYSTTKSLQIASHSHLAGTVMFALSALALHGQEPISLRYFDIERDGSLRYLDEAELDARAAGVKAARGKRKKKYKTRQYWREQISAFANMEIQFRARGAADGAPLRVYRHIVANLDDPHLADEPQILAHLQAKGDVAVMTKAASYLLWLDEFSQIRNYLLAHTIWMISDSSGVPPDHASAAGYEQITYGQFTRPFFTRDPKKVASQMIRLWNESPQRPLRFRFGYPDGEGNGHLLVMRRKQ